MIPLTLFLYLAVDAPAQSLMRALFKKSRFKIRFHTTTYHLLLKYSLVYLASVAPPDRELDKSVNGKIKDCPREHEGEGGEAASVEELKEIKSND